MFAKVRDAQAEGAAGLCTQPTKDPMRPFNLADGWEVSLRLYVADAVTSTACKAITHEPRRTFDPEPP